MASVTKMFIRAREIVARRFHGQTMVEYALIIASIGVYEKGVTTRLALVHPQLYSLGDLAEMLNRSERVTEQQLG